LSNRQGVEAGRRGLAVRLGCVCVCGRSLGRAFEIDERQMVSTTKRRLRAPRPLPATVARFPGGTPLPSQSQSSAERTPLTRLPFSAPLKFTLRRSSCIAPGGRTFVHQQSGGAKGSESDAAADRAERAAANTTRQTLSPPRAPPLPGTAKLESLEDDPARVNQPLASVHAFRPVPSSLFREESSPPHPPPSDWASLRRQPPPAPPQAFLFDQNQTRGGGKGPRPCRSRDALRLLIVTLISESQIDE